MCWQVLLPVLGGALGLGASLLAPKPADPPPVPAQIAPAVPADAARAAGATVRIGDGQQDDTTKVEGVATAEVPETRVFGRPVGGLGKSGLTI